MHYAGQMKDPVQAGELRLRAANYLAEADAVEPDPPGLGGPAVGDIPAATAPGIELPAPLPAEPKD